MTQDQLKELALQSPALVNRSTEERKFAYPERWQGKVPLKVRTTRTITSDLPMFFPESADLIAVANNEYFVNVNIYGFVSAILPDGRHLGLKPNEFEVIEFHPEKVDN